MFRQFAVMMILLVHTSAALADVPLPPKKNAGNGPAVEATPWWDEEQSGWLGGLVGGTVGILGAVFGVTAGLGKSRSFVLALAMVLIGTGLVLLAIGTVAWSGGQPWHVYYLFLIIGGVLTLVMGLNYPILKRRYDQMDFQRIREANA